MQDKVAFYNKRINSKKFEMEKLNKNYKNITKAGGIIWQVRGCMK